MGKLEFGIGVRGKLRIADRHLNCDVYSVYDLID